MNALLKDIITNKAVWLNIAIAILLYFSILYDFSYASSIQSPANSKIPYFWIALIFTLVVVMSLIHELSHWLSAKLQRMKNKAFGFMLFAFFVFPDMRGFKRYKKALVLFDGAFISLATPFILLAFLIKINLITFSVFVFLLVLGIFNALFEIMQLFPFLFGDDGYEIASYYIKSEKKLSIFSYSFAGIFIVAFSIITNIPIIFLLPLIALMIIWNLFIVKKFTKISYEIYNNGKTRGFHKISLKIYEWKVPIGFYYRF